MMTVKIASYPSVQSAGMWHPSLHFFVLFIQNANFSGQEPAIFRIKKKLSLDKSIDSQQRSVLHLGAQRYKQSKLICHP